MNDPACTCGLDRVRTFFSQRPTGRVLVLIVLLKLFIMFFILRLIFFQPAMKGLNEEEKADAVGSVLTNK